MIRRASVSVVAGLSALLLAGCALTSPLRAAAARARALDSPLVVRVEFQEDWLDGESVAVYLVSSATGGDARLVWCTVVEPAGLSDFDTTMYDASGEHSWDSPDCDDPSDLPALS